MRGAASIALAAALVLFGADAQARRRNPPPPPAEPVPITGGLVDNVNGYTFDRGGKLRRFNGLELDRAGKVLRLLSAGDRRPERPAFKLEGRGRTLIPGLFDAHGHVMDLGFAALRLDLSETRSLGEAQAKLRRYAADHPNLRWIQGFGWNQELWGLGRMPTAADLDAAVPDRPVWLERVDGHAGVVNSAALAEAKLNAATPTPAGGQIGRGAGGKPDGFLADAARALITDIIPPPTPRERDQALARAQEILLGYGVVAICDMGTRAVEWDTYRRAGDAGRLSVRITSYALGIDPLVAIAGSGPTPWLYGDRLRMVGVKLYADGALGSRGAWMKAAYADAPGTRGTPLLADAQLRNLMSRAAMDDFQVAVHAIGDAANAQVLDAIDELSETYKGDRRWRIEHAQVIDPKDLPRFGRHGTVASMQPVHQTSDRLMAEARLGPGRLEGAYAWASVTKTGAPLAFGSDAPVERPDPFAGMAAAISRQDAAGEPAGGWQPQERVSIEQALAAYTTGAAYAAQAEDRLGSLEPGHDADFLLVDRDILHSEPAAIRATVVEEVWIGGTRAWVHR